MTDGGFLANDPGDPVRPIDGAGHVPDQAGPLRAAGAGAVAGRGYVLLTIELPIALAESLFADIGGALVAHGGLHRAQAEARALLERTDGEGGGEAEGGGDGRG